MNGRGHLALVSFPGLVQVLVPLGDFLGQLVLVAGLELWAARQQPRSESGLRARLNLHHY